MRWLRLLALVFALPVHADDALSARVQALEQAGVVLRGAAAADADLVTEVEAGLEALPPAMRRPPGGPLELVLHPEAAPLGLGDGSPARPDWTEGRARFHLYQYAPSEERRATLRLSRLTEAEVERLWRRRAVVHAVMQRWDDAKGWSGTPAWRRLSGWMKPFERPLVVEGGGPPSLRRSFQPRHGAAQRLIGLGDVRRGTARARGVPARGRAAGG